jgi:predicted membrane chloride channel (bestrophin family)
MSKLNESFHSTYQGDPANTGAAGPRRSTGGGVWSRCFGGSSSNAATVRSKRTLEDYSRVTNYGGLSTLQFLLQMYGSVWPFVFPWCVVVGLFTYAVYVLKEHGIDITIHNGSGHSFMSLLVSFLVVTRTSLIFNKFQHSRQVLQNLFGACGEVVQHSCLLTTSNTNPEAKAWRSKVAYTTVIALRAAVSALEYKSSRIPCWTFLPPFDDGDIDLMLHTDPGDKPATISALKALAHGKRNEYTENFRVPKIWAYNLRKVILAPRNDPGILKSSGLQTNEQLRILDFVTQYVHAWEEMNKLASSPFPFPLAQMTRTFLLFWVFSLPLVLIKDDTSLWATFLVIFGITYGFFGLEYVALQLSDPYGQDENDFPAS